jgi:biotin carboxylase
MAKVLILGVGNAQVDALRYLKDAGCMTFGLSHANEGRGIAYCDHFDVIDIKDKHNVLAYAEKNQLDLVYSVGSDLAMPTIGYVSEQLGLPYFCSEENATLLNDKFLFRNFLKEKNLLGIVFQGGKHWKDFRDWNSFPAIIKPVRSQGQRGIRRIDNKADMKKLIEQAQQFSDTGEVILEEFMTGAEVSANVFLKDGDILYSFISDRTIYEGLEGGLVKSHLFPTKMDPGMQDRALHLISETVRHLDIRNGPLYFQMMHTPEDVQIIEATPRLDGCHIWRLIRSYTGIDLLQTTFDTLLGEPIPAEAVQPDGNLQGLYFFSQEPYRKFDGGDYEIPDACQYHEFYYEQGEEIRPLNRIFEKVGYYIK